MDVVVDVRQQMSMAVLLLLTGLSCGGVATQLPGVLGLSSILVWALTVVLTIRAARSGIVVTSHGLTVRKVWSTITVPAAALEGIGWTIAFAPMLTACAVVRRSPGRDITVPGVRISQSYRRTAEQGVADLSTRINRTLQSAR